jgi:DNA-binding NarL/FixJ family response regulator
MPIRAVVAEDSFLVREAVVRVLQEAEDLELVATAADAATLLAAVEEYEPDVVVTDIRMPPTDSDDGIRVAALLRGSHPDVGVVVLSQYAEPEFVLGLLEDGSDGRAYLLKERVHHAGQLVNAVRAVHDGGSYVDPELVGVLVKARSRAAHSPLRELTPRELETLAQIAEGKSNEAIAQSLFLTKRAVEKHINSIFMKLNLADAPDVARRVKAALMFLSEVDSAGRLPEP